MTHFPLFLDLKDKNIIIFGGGAFSLQRVNKLLPFKPLITVISQAISDEIKAVEGIRCEERPFSDEDLNTAPAFVIIAEDEEETAKIYGECQKRNIPVNAVDMPKYCDIIFPSVISTEHLCIGISSGGISPTATVEFKEKIESLIPSNIDEILEWMPHAKSVIKENSDKRQQKALLREAFKIAIMQNSSLTDKELLNIMNSTEQ